MDNDHMRESAVELSEDQLKEISGGNSAGNSGGNTKTVTTYEFTCPKCHANFPRDNMTDLKDGVRFHYYMFHNTQLNNVDLANIANANYTVSTGTVSTDPNPFGGGFSIPGNMP